MDGMVQLELAARAGLALLMVLAVVGACVALGLLLGGVRGRPGLGSWRRWAGRRTPPARGSVDETDFGEAFSPAEGTWFLNAEGGPAPGSSADAVAEAGPRARGWARGLLAALFPTGRPDHPEDGHWIHTEIWIRVDWRDRLRILVSGKARVDCATATDVEVSRCWTTSTFHVLPPGVAMPRKDRS